MFDKARMPDWPVGVRLHQLEGFFHVATHEGYARASAAIPYSISEPALHQQVRKLESALGGVRLLERAPGRRMVLTPPGRTLYRFIEPYFKQLPGILRTLSKNLGGTLVVATEPFYVEELCAPTLKTMIDNNSDIKVQLLELDRPQIIDVVSSGRVDIGVTVKMDDVPEGMAFEVIGELGLQLLLPPGSDFVKKRKPPTVAQLEGMSFVVYPEGTEGRLFTDTAKARSGASLNTVAEATSSAAMRALVSAGVGAAFVPALYGTGRKRKKRTHKDGTVAFDFSDSLREVTGLPHFGIFRRRVGTRKIIKDFCDIAKKQLRE
jgi:DNA-binding transcriptional LysR family regulator